MLTTLRVKNLALAENILVEFGPGLNIITGETGAGKSILMGALNLVLGGRADKSMIRAGEDACGAEAVFQLADCAVVDEILAQGDLPPCEDGQLIVRRIIKRGGGSQNRVNDASVTLQTLKQLGAWLVDMHGPHDHQSLLRNETQLQLLDAYAQNEKARVAYDGIYRQVRELERDREALLGDDEELEIRKDMLAFRVKELEEAALDPHEAEEVEKEHSVLGNAQRIQELAGGVLQALSGDEGSAYDCLVSARSALNELGRLVPDAESWSEQADTLVTLLQDLETDIQRTVGDIESSPVRLEWLDNRLAVYQKMKRKYGGSVESALEVLAESREHLQDLESRGERLATIEQDLAASRKELEAAGRALRKTRKDAARKLAKAVQRQLKALELAGGEFEVVFTEQDPGSSGMDGIDFEFAPNVGEPRSSLKAIASSGEISRVMLAMKTVLAEHDRVPVLVFDEIDANIGGETGSAVGQKLADVAQKHQVMCITHLPQVAVFGTAHYAVAKQVRDGRTSSTVTPLEEDGRVEEVARMLGGRDLTSVTLDHAREMLAANSPSD